MGERGEHRLGRGVDGTAGALVTTPGRLRGVQDLGRRLPLQNAGHLADLLSVDPPHDIGHGPPIERGRREQGRQQLRCRGVPEVPVGRRPLALGRLAQLGGGPAGLAPLTTTGERRPGTGARSRGTGRIDAPHLAQARPCPQGVAQEIALDAGGDDRSAPTQNRRDGQARGLPALRRTDHHQGLCRFRRQARRPRQPLGGRRGGGARAERRQPRPSAAAGHVVEPSAPRALRRGRSAPSSLAPSWRWRRTARPRGRAAAQRRTDPSRPPYPAVMAASVSTMRRSVALSRCCTRKDR